VQPRRRQRRYLKDATRPRATSTRNRFLRPLRRSSVAGSSRQPARVPSAAVGRATARGDGVEPCSLVLQKVQLWTARGLRPATMCCWRNPCLVHSGRARDQQVCAADGIVRSSPRKNAAGYCFTKGQSLAGECLRSPQRLGNRDDESMSVGGPAESNTGEGEGLCREDG